jgi:membrane protein DedA with SNARE-associated domain/rhodanese-related sulfurtransferase
VLAVFGALLIEQIGLPLPATPFLLLAGARAVDQPWFGVAALACAIAACSIANFGWYAAGRHYGSRVLSLLCRVSLSPDSCVRQTESVFERRGAAALLTAKFVPGLTVIAPPMAAALGVRVPAFALFNTAGAALYCGSFLALGAVFHDQVARLIDWLQSMGGRALMLLAALLAAYVAYRAIDRWLFLRKLRLARVDVPELARMLRDGEAPVILDVRSGIGRAASGIRIPGARNIDMASIAVALDGVATDRELIVYCACPNEASAAKLALELRRHGFRKVRPLAGGIDAWVSAGQPVEPAVVPTAPEP